MKIKQLVSLVLTTLLLFTSASASFATNNDAPNQGLYILSKKCPEEYVNYAKEMVGYLLWDYSLKSPSLGEPFTFANQDSDIYYFPIYSNDEIDLTFRVYLGEDGRPTGVVSPAFAAELNAIAKMTSSSDPLRITYENRENYSAVIFYLNNYEEEVQINPITKEISDISIASLNNEFEIVNCVPVETIQLLPSARTSKNLSLSITETQGYNNWCLAYCTAIVMRYHGVNKTAKQVMTDIHGSNVSTEASMGRTNLVSYMQGNGFNTEKSENWPTYGNTYLTIISEINKYRPVILNMNSNDTNSQTAHALVAKGYEDIKGTTSVWNPWYNYFEIVVDLNNYTLALETPELLRVAEYWYNNYR